jgi:DNA-binding IclR family transcriptional regulator
LLAPVTSATLPTSSIDAPLAVRFERGRYPPARAIIATGCKPGTHRVIQSRKERHLPDVVAAARALSVFEAYSEELRALSLSELARKLEIPVSSCRLLILTLLRRGYLYEAEGRYYPTSRMLEQVGPIARRDPVLERLAPALARLRDETQETVTLAKLQSAQVIYLSIYDSPRRPRPLVTGGSLRPIHSTAAGKALLSACDARTRDALLGTLSFERYTPRTARSRTELEAQLAAMSARGWYSNDGETWRQSGGLAVPLRLHRDAYAITVTGPPYRLRSRQREYVAALTAARDRLAQDFAVARSSRSAKRQKPG